jgi:nucleotidyltransferase/DNA polymerase involved in DNA repair
MLVCFIVPEVGLACERARNPRLKCRPLALLDALTTVRVASSEAIKYGVRVGQSGVRARNACRRLTVLPYDEDAYVEYAQWAWDKIAAEAHSVYPVSAEQCFALMSTSDTPQRVHDLTRALTEQFHVPVQVGMGNSMNAAEDAACRIADVLSAQAALVSRPATFGTSI